MPTRYLYAKYEPPTFLMESHGRRRESLPLPKTSTRPTARGKLRPLARTRMESRPRMKPVPSGANFKLARFKLNRDMARGVQAQAGGSLGLTGRLQSFKLLSTR